MKPIERQDIKLMIDSLDNLFTSDHSDEEYDNFVIESAISMLEDLGNAYHALQLENTNLKDSLDIRKAYYDSVFQDGANRIKKLMEENYKLKQDILQLEAMIED